MAPGTYYERLEIDKPIDLIGVGPIGSVRIISVDGPVVQVASGKVACRVAKLCLEQQAAEGAPMSGAVRVEGGAVLVLEECSVASASGHCIVIKVRCLPASHPQGRRDLLGLGTSPPTPRMCTHPAASFCLLACDRRRQLALLPDDCCR